jgi:hypothetical protein
VVLPLKRIQADCSSIAAEFVGWAFGWATGCSSTRGNLKEAWLIDLHSPASIYELRFDSASFLSAE